MDSEDGLSLYPSNRCKTIHLVRHAQEVAMEKDHSVLVSDDFLDAQLSTSGWNQVDRLRTHVQSTGLSKRIELVITSPFLRTMQTAVGAFGGENCSYDRNFVPLMLENAGYSNRRPISSLNCPKFWALDVCREYLATNPCDKRAYISKYQCLFPAIDFTKNQDNDDIQWKEGMRETKEEVVARGRKFLKWLCTLKAKEIAVVSHCEFLFNTLAAFGNDCHPSTKRKICKTFAKGELRSIVLIDRSADESESLTTDFGGTIPQKPRSPRSRLRIKT